MPKHMLVNYSKGPFCDPSKSPSKGFSLGEIIESKQNDSAQGETPPAARLE